MPSPPARWGFAWSLPVPAPPISSPAWPTPIWIRFPLVAITGQVPTALIGTDGFQEADVVGITRSCTKHNYLVKNIQELPQIMRDAFFIARIGPAGSGFDGHPQGHRRGFGGSGNSQQVFHSLVEVRADARYQPNRQDRRADQATPRSP